MRQIKMNIRNDLFTLVLWSCLFCTSLWQFLHFEASSVSLPQLMINVHRDQMIGLFVKYLTIATMKVCPMVMFNRENSMFSKRFTNIKDTTEVEIFVKSGHTYQMMTCGVVVVGVNYLQTSVWLNKLLLRIIWNKKI